MSDGAGVNDEVDLIEVEPEGPRRRPRRCIASRQRRERRHLLRFVVAPDGRLVPDLDARLPGRGLWLSADQESLKTALSRDLFAKAARRRLIVDPDLVSQLHALLERRCLQWLGLARRAGTMVLGFEQVMVAARAGEIDLLVVARDAGTDGKAKLIDTAASGWIGLFTREQMGGAVGREALVYAGLRPGRLAGRLIDDATRLAGLTGDAEAVRSERPAAASAPDVTASVSPAPLGMIETA